MSGPARPALTRAEGWALAGGLAVAVALMWPLRGYVTDDTFIHLQVARHLAEGQGPVFNPGERVYGSTSPLWVGLLAAAMALGLDGLQAARAIGAAATLASIGLMLQLLRQTVRAPAFRAAGTLVWAGHAWMLRWSLSGMEVPLAVAFTLGGFVAFTAGARPGARAGLTGTLWALAALTRPEGLALLGLWAALRAIEWREPGGARRFVAGTIGPLLLCGGWLLFAALYYGTPWPQTLAAKTAGASGAAYHLGNLWRQARIVGATDGLLVSALLIAAAAAGRLPAGGGAAARALPWAWVLGLPALYAVRGVPVLSRYLLPALPVLAWLAWRAADRAWGAGDTPKARRRAGYVAVALAALVLAQNLVVYRTQVLPHVRTFSPALEASLVAWGRWFDRHAAPDAVIATPDIGAIGYFGRRRVLDLAGLVSPPMVPLLASAEPESVVAHLGFSSFARPEYLVDRAPAGHGLMERSPYADCLTPLGEAPVPNLGVARRDPVVYAFYRVDWAVFDTLAARR